MIHTIQRGTCSYHSVNPTQPQSYAMANAMSCGLSGSIGCRPSISLGGEINDSTPEASSFLLLCFASFPVFHTSFPVLQTGGCERSVSSAGAQQLDATAHHTHTVNDEDEAAFHRLFSVTIGTSRVRSLVR